MKYEFNERHYDFKVSHPLPRSRRRTRRVAIGGVGVGGEEPIRVQSMTTTLTTDAAATAEQAARMVDAGCEIVRVTTPNLDDVQAIPEIRRRMKDLGREVPLIADVHFNPGVAYEATKVADKVRINPGNFADGKRFKAKEYSDEEYAGLLAKVKEKTDPLIDLLKKNKASLRLGVNHGSLSDRVMNRYGDSPEGMVQCCLEYLELCEKRDFRDIIISLKASNPKVMIQAYRLLARRLDETGRDYPFHLGVTEAGGGAEGRLKSAVGIATLLDEGLGDTIRVSLTEDPAAEIPVAFSLLGLFKSPPLSISPALSSSLPPVSVGWDPDRFKRRASRPLSLGGISLGGDAPVRVAVWGRPTGGWEKPSSEEETPELVFLAPGTAAPQGLWARGVSKTPSTTAEPAEFLWGDPRTLPQGSLPRVALADARNVADLAEAAKKDPALILGLKAEDGSSLSRAGRWLAGKLDASGLQPPLILVSPSADPLAAGAALGGLLADGLGDAVLIPGPVAESSALARKLLQAAGARISAAEYVACPGCGRTLFELESTTNRIQAQTGHLRGVKIAVMGCIVNGPGEMADADFGYVGGAPGKVNLYVGKECVEKGIPTEDADGRLLALIKSRGKWVEPKT